MASGRPGAAVPPEVSRWSPVVAFAMVSAANQMLWLTYTPITTDAAHHYDVSVGAVGWLAEIFPLVYVVLALPMGRLIDRWFRAGLGVGASVTALGACVRLVGGSFAAVLAGQVLVAVAQPLVLNAVTKVSASFLRDGDRPTGIAVSSAGIFVGMVLALLSGTIAGVGHLSALLAFQAAFAVVAAGWLAFGLRRSRGPRGLSEATRRDDTAPATTGVRVLLADRGIVLLVLLAAGGFGVFVALTTWLQTLLEPAGVSESEAGTLLLVMVVAGVLGAGLLSASLVRRGHELRFLAVSVVGGAAALCWLAVTPGFATALPALGLLGVLLLTDLPLILDLLERRAGDSAGTATALLWLMGNLGGLVLAVVVQVLVHRPAIAFLVLAAALVAVLPGIARLHRRLDLSAGPRLGTEESA